MHITQYLQGCTNLQTLHLDDNGLGDRVTTHLLDHHLRTMPLTTLDLGSNSLSPNIVPALCQALSEMRAMRKLLLQHNFLGPAGARHLSEIWPETSRIQEVNLSDNYITDTASEAMLAWASRSPVLQCITLNSNSFSDQVTEYLNAAENLTASTRPTAQLRFAHDWTPPPAEALRGRPIGICLFEAFRHFIDATPKATQRADKRSRARAEQHGQDLTRCQAYPYNTTTPPKSDI